MTETDRDLTDARLVADVAAALRAWQEASGRPAATKTLRETVWFYWQNPRMPRPRVSGKYPRSARWSREAAEVVLDGDGTVQGRLVIEHIEPMHRLLRRLIDEPLEPTEVASVLSAGLDVVLVTKEQSKLLPDAGSAEERYRAAGLDLNDFRSLDDWQDEANAWVSQPEHLAGVAVGDVLWDAVNREWAVVDADKDGLALQTPTVKCSVSPGTAC